MYDLSDISPFLFLYLSYFSLFSLSILFANIVIMTNDIAYKKQQEACSLAFCSSSLKRRARRNTANVLNIKYSLTIRSCLVRIYNTLHIKRHQSTSGGKEEKAVF